MKAVVAMCALALAVLANAVARAETPSGEVTGNESADREESPTNLVVVRGAWLSPRGAGDARVSRETLDAAPHQQTSELLSTAPGFFVDHEDTEGLGNDVNLRGWDLEHGSGIEMRVGGIPINNPVHVRGQGYADVNFVVPELVRSIHVLEGPYDPRQGDAAIAGSVDFDLAVPERGYRLGTSYGSFGQSRLFGLLAPKEADQETFAAFTLRKTDGFGLRRAGRSGAANAQYGMDLGQASHVRVFGAAYGAEAELPGVIRKDDLDAGRIGLYDTYPSVADNQSVRSSRVLLGASFQHTTRSGGNIAMVPWVMWTGLRARQNFTGSIQTSQIDPTLSGLGDLFETRNAETAAGLDAHFRSASQRLGENVEVVTEPGVFLRGGRSEQGKDLLRPSTLSVWDRRLDASIDTMDTGAYLDVDFRLFQRLRISGGARADLLLVSVADRLSNLVPGGLPDMPPGARRDAAGVVVGPRVTTEYTVSERIAVSASYGEGFRSADAVHLPDGSTHPYSTVRSVEAGLRANDGERRYRTTLSVFRSWVENELVFDAESGAYEPEPASVRQGVVGAFLAKPVPWLLSSTALSVTDARFVSPIAGASDHVPNVPTMLLRTDATVHHAVSTIRGTAVVGRVGAGYTLLSGRHLVDGRTTPAWNVLNATVGARYGAIDLAVDAYNLLGLRYSDTADLYASNWSVRPGGRPASTATHVTAAAPRAVIATLTLVL